MIKFLQSPSVFNFRFMFIKRVKSVGFYVFLAIILIGAIVATYLHMNSLNKTGFAGYAQFTGDPIVQPNNPLQITGIVTPCVLLIFYVQQYVANVTTADIIEEKQSRSMEIIITSISPLAHFVGKLLLNLFVGLILIAWVLFAFSITDLIMLAPKYSAEGAGFNPWFIWGISLGVYNVHSFGDLYISQNGFGNPSMFLLFLFLIGITTLVITAVLLMGLVSIVSNPQDAGLISLPLMMIPTIGLVLSFFVMGNTSLLSILSHIPILSASMIPYEYAALAKVSPEISGSILVTAWTSAAINFGVLLVAVPFGAIIYKQGILNYAEGNPLKQLSSTIKSLKYNVKFFKKSK